MLKKFQSEILRVRTTTLRIGDIVKPIIFHPLVPQCKFSHAVGATSFTSVIVDSVQRILVC